MDKLYLDTSIPSAYYDTSKPVRQLITQKWFETESPQYSLCVSTVVLDEIRRLANVQKREAIEELLLSNEVDVLEVSREAMDLAERYIALGAIPAKEPEDALHIAVAVVNRVDYLASWNFKHIVSANPIRKVHEISAESNYPCIEIGSLEIFGGSKYGNV